MADGSPRLLNRELSWLDFDDRVLRLASEPGIPLLERVKFCAIFSANLDEFFQVRIAALKDQVAAGITTPSPDGRSPALQLSEAGWRVGELVDRQQHILHDVLLPLLHHEGIELIRWADLDDLDRKHVVQEFEQRIFPVLTPLAVDPSHPFPYISNLALSIAAVVRDPVTEERRFARVKVPNVFPRLVALPDGHRFIPVEEVIGAHLPSLFSGMQIETWSTFRVTRNADLTLEEEEADDLLAAVEMELRRRRFGRAVRLEVAHDIDDEVLDFLLSELELDERDVSRHRGLLDLTCLMQLHAIDRPDLKDEPWHPVTAGRLHAADEADRSIFSVVRERALLVHHPYESFASSVEAFIAQAADDPKVQSIKVTLYRTSGDSAIARSLIRAAERGVQVAALVELKARFDEAVNVTWAKTLERAGVHVAYGLVGLKIHAKCVLVVRQDDDGLRRYVHIGTGNYNSRTARTYEDIGYITCDPEIGADVTQLFNHLTGFSRDVEYGVLRTAPHHLRSEIVDLIENEARHGTEGHITIKVNSLADVEVIEALYAASEAGVTIDLVVRGICCLRPGVVGMSSNIRVRSVLGRYLEHSRVYRFAHGDDDGGSLYLVGSADLMERNLDKRVEVLVPVPHPKHRAWLDTMLQTLLSPDAPCFELDADGVWHRVGPVGFEPHPQHQMFSWVAESQSRHRRRVS